MSEPVLFATAHVDRGRQVLCFYYGYDAEGDVHSVHTTTYCRELDLHIRYNLAFPDRDRAMHYFTCYRTDEAMRAKVFDALEAGVCAARAELCGGPR